MENSLSYFLKEFVSEHPKLTKKYCYFWIQETSDKQIQVHLGDINAKNKFEGWYEKCFNIFEFEANQFQFEIDFGKIEIWINHDFIFDQRLIQNTYQGIKINGVCYGDLPQEFPSPENDNTLLVDVYSPEKYELFVNNHFELIQKELKLQKASVNELLDALNGGFKKYKSHCEKVKAKHQN